VPDEERVRAQSLDISVRLFIGRETVRVAALGDDVGATVDYAVVCEVVREVVAERERKLLETLAEEICAAVFSRCPRVRAVELRLSKFILPHTRDVTLRVFRVREG
jgi:dihydroneopterin aldolase